MNGAVHAINPQRGMVAIEAGGHGFTIIELMSGESIELGDQIEWSSGYGMGGQTYRNLTKGCSFRVYVQNHGVHKSQLRQQLLIQ